MSLQSAKRAVAIICSAYRTPHGIVDEVFMELAAEGLQHFSDEILQQLVHPRHGLIGTNKFMPTIAEMIEFCQTKARTSYAPPPPPNSHPALLVQQVSKEARERIQKKFAELLADLSHGIDYFQAYQKHVQPGERFTVWDAKYIDFVESHRADLKAAREAKEAPVS